MTEAEFARHIDAEIARLQLARAGFALPDPEMPQLPPRRPTVPQVMRAVAREWSVTIDDLRSSSRKHVHCHPRQVAMWISRIIFARSLNQTSLPMGGRDHTTTINAIRRVYERRLADPAFAARIDAVVRELIPGYVEAQP